MRGNHYFFTDLTYTPSIYVKHYVGSEKKKKIEDNILDRAL